MLGQVVFDLADAAVTEHVERGCRCAILRSQRLRGDNDQLRKQWKADFLNRDAAADRTLAPMNNRWSLVKLKVDCGLSFQFNALGAHHDDVRIVRLIVSLTRLAMAERTEQWGAINGVTYVPAMASANTSALRRVEIN